MTIAADAIDHYHPEGVSPDATLISAYTWQPTDTLTIKRLAEVLPIERGNELQGKLGFGDALQKESAIPATREGGSFRSFLRFSGIFCTRADLN